jgi:ATP adenylyltransferase
VKYGARSATQQERMQRRSNAAVFVKWATEVDRIFSPWRMEYIRRAGGGEGTAPCVFCVRDGDLEDPEKLLVGLYPATSAILNRYPYNNGHVLIAPRRHVANLWDLSSEELREIFSLVSLGVQALAQEYRTEGMNVGMNLGKAAGAGIADHLHVHLVPRWTGDTNFMTPVQETRVLPESLLESRRRLSAVFGPLRP